MVIVKAIPTFIESLRDHRLFVPAMISLLTWMRLALRWARLILDAKVIEIREALEETKAHCIRVTRARKNPATGRVIDKHNWVKKQTHSTSAKQSVSAQVQAGAPLLLELTFVSRMCRPQSLARIFMTAELVFRVANFGLLVFSAVLALMLLLNVR